MGYDDGECVECRCELNGGNTSEYTRYNICPGCLNEISYYTCAMDYRLLDVLKNNMDLGSNTCDRCTQVCTIHYNVSVCQYHYDKRVYDKRVYDKRVYDKRVIRVINDSNENDSNENDSNENDSNENDSVG
jgi:hypothetical protein